MSKRTARLISNDNQYFDQVLFSQKKYFTIKYNSEDFSIALYFVYFAKSNLKARRINHPDKYIGRI